MDSFSAFARGQATRGEPKMVFDWDKAARLIADRQPVVARAGLHSDWEWTGGTIYSGGAPILDDYTYLASTWATPELDIDGDVTPCFKMEADTDWGSDTKWPESALTILKGGPQ